MADKAPRRGAANIGVPIMILAFLVIAGFLYWLSLQAQKQKAVEIREDSAAAASDSMSSGATALIPSDLQTNAGQYLGQHVQVSGLTVASQLGTAGFWLNLPSGTPFLVSLSDTLRQQGVSAKTGETATVVGTMKQMSDSVVNAWTTAGTISQADRAAAGFAQFYIEATQIKTAAPAAGGSGSGS